MSLPIDRDARNALPIWDGVMIYFPDAWPEIAKVSVIGNKQHNLDSAKLYFNRQVSTDHLNKVMRHLLDHESGKVFDTDGTRHLAKAAWRVLAALQVSIEKENPSVVSSYHANSVGSPKTSDVCSGVGPFNAGHTCQSGQGIHSGHPQGTEAAGARRQEDY